MRNDPRPAMPGSALRAAGRIQRRPFDRLARRRLRIVELGHGAGGNACLRYVGALGYFVTGAAMNRDGCSVVELPRRTEDPGGSIAELTKAGRLLPSPDSGRKTRRSAGKDPVSAATRHSAFFKRSVPAALPTASWRFGPVPAGR